MLLVLLLLPPAWGQEAQYPAPHGWVNDVAQVLDPATEDRLHTLLADLERRTSVEMATACGMTT
jgi:uncharacterized membrane protein YgcG